jgi:hypothetical protein
MVEFKKWYKRHTKTTKKSNYSRQKIDIEERAERVLEAMSAFYTAKKYDVSTKYTYEDIKEKKIVYKLHRAKIASGCGENVFISVKHQILDLNGYYRLGWDFMIEEQKYNKLEDPTKKKNE